MQGRGREGLLQRELLCVCQCGGPASLGEGVALRPRIKLVVPGLPRPPSGTVGPWHT